MHPTYKCNHMVNMAVDPAELVINKILHNYHTKNWREACIRIAFIFRVQKSKEAQKYPICVMGQ